ncbi:MAG: 4-amino-4-deoxy-L-arabinose transferase, partial [Isosphaeraceae bacterium]|nr:4-amino-4-deoxy-L-arabinose transferase [Isosphaeraceae bacterium]
MLDLGFLLLLMLWSAGIGLRMLARLVPIPEHPADALSLAIPLGLGALALATLGLAELGLLTRGGIIAILGSGALLCGTPGPRLRGLIAEEPAPRGALDWASDLALAVALVGTLLTALTPVTDGDALCYHLQVPKVFLASQAATFEPDLHETVYPLVMEMLYTVALAVRGPVACRLVSWLFGLVFALNVSAQARPVLK